MPEESVAAPTSEIDDARSGFISAVRRGDVHAAAAFYTEDARLLAPSSETLIGPVAIARFWQAGFEAGVEGIDLECERVELEPGGALAYELGRYVLRLQPMDGDAVIERGRYVLVHRREADGTWRRAVETFNPDGTTGTAAV